MRKWLDEQSTNKNHRFQILNGQRDGKTTFKKRSEKDSQNRRNANFVQFENQTRNEKMKRNKMKNK